MSRAGPQRRRASFDWFFRPAGSAEDAPLSEETAFADVLAELPAVERSALALSEIGGLEPEEIAARLGTDLEVATTVLGRARATARMKLRDRRAGLAALVPWQWLLPGGAPAARAAGVVAAAVVGTSVVATTAAPEAAAERPAPVVRVQQEERPAVAPLRTVHPAAPLAAPAGGLRRAAPAAAPAPTASARLVVGPRRAAPAGAPAARTRALVPSGRPTRPPAPPPRRAPAPPRTETPTRTVATRVKAPAGAAVPLLAPVPPPSAVAPVETPALPPLEPPPAPQVLAALTETVAPPALP